MQEETHLWRGSPSQWENLGVFLVALSFAWLGLPLLWAVWRYLVTRCTRYEITSERISLEQGVLSKRMDELELYRVKDTTFEQPFLLRLVGLSHVVVRSTDQSHPELVIRAIRDGRGLRENLRGAIEKIRKQKRVQTVEV